MPSRESLYHRFPDYRVDLEPEARHVRVRFGGELIADSRRAIRVLETKHEPVVYLPRQDVQMQRLERTDHESFCPFKGDASYWTIRVGEQTAENAVWGYDDPFEQVAELSDYLAFYPERVEWELD